jgi:hypothetical protein
MITISILGLDQFVVGRYSKDNSANLANLFESDENLLNFYAPNAMVFHHGTEQTSWNTIVIVRAPIKYKACESKVAEYLMKTLSEFSINVEIEFEYFEQSSHYEHINDSYPRYIASDNIVSTDDMPGEHDEDDEDEEPDPRDRSDLDPNDPNQIYLGNAFEGFEDKLAAKEKESAAKPSEPKKK